MRLVVKKEELDWAKRMQDEGRTRDITMTFEKFMSEHRDSLKESFADQNPEEFKKFARELYLQLR